MFLPVSCRNQLITKPRCEILDDGARRSELPKNRMIFIVAMIGIARAILGCLYVTGRWRRGAVPRTKVGVMSAATYCDSSSGYCQYDTKIPNALNVLL